MLAHRACRTSRAAEAPRPDCQGLCVAEPGGTALLWAAQYSIMTVYMEIRRQGAVTARLCCCMPMRGVKVELVPEEACLRHIACIDSMSGYATGTTQGRSPRIDTSIAIIAGVAPANPPLRFAESCIALLTCGGIEEAPWATAPEQTEHLNKRLMPACPLSRMQCTT